MILKMPLRRVLGNIVVLRVYTLRRKQQPSECVLVRTSTNGTCSKTIGKYA
jgi:hypothetical protein